MKRKLSLALVLVMLLAFMPLAGGVFAQDDIRIEIDGEMLELDVAPIVESGRVLLPIAHMLRALGAEVTWNAADRTVTIQQNDISILLEIDDQIAIVNGNAVMMDVPARILNSRTIVPLRFVAENLEAEVVWNEEHRIVHVTSADDDFVIRSIPFEVVAEADRDANLAAWVEENLMNEGLYVYIDDSDWTYVLAAGGERPTGGYVMNVLTVTEIDRSVAFVEAELEMPGIDEMVTQALTYPHELIRFDGSEIGVVTGEIRELRRGAQEVTLYFMETTDTAFLAAGEPRLFQQADLTVGNLMTELLAGPQSGTLSRVIPSNVTLLDASVVDGIAYVDFSGELAQINVGAEVENVLVTSIVWTLVQLNDVDAVQILVEGEVIESLAGHVTINEPLTRE
jgi:hypothetical protein